MKLNTPLFRLAGRLLTAAGGGLLFNAVVSAAPADVDTVGLEQALVEWAGAHPGVIVAVVIEGDARGFATAGRWSADAMRPADADTGFEIGSITKVFTALLAADAVGEGALRWSDPLADPYAGTAVTYGQLATHTAGLPRLPRDFPDATSADPYATVGATALGRSFALETAELKPGPHPWAYSNLGAAVLGQAVAHRLGTDYVSGLQNRVLRRLGMDATWISGGLEGDLERLAPGHAGNAAASRWRFDAYAPAGALVSTAADLERFMRALLDPAAAGLPAAWAATFEAQAETDGPARMGRGWFINEVGGQAVYWHGGGTGGYRSFLGIQPATGRGIAVLAARDQAVEGIGLGWLQGLFNPKAGAAAIAVSDGSELEGYAGDYPIAPSFILSVTVDDGRLFVQGTRQPRFALSATGPDAFALEGVPAALTFARDSNGLVTGVVLHQNGAETRAPRHPAGTVHPEKRHLTLTPEALDPLVGDYPLAPNFVLTVSRRGAQLFVQATGQPRLPVFASAPDVFFYDAVAAEVHFQRDGEGKVTGLVLHQNGQKMPAPRVSSGVKP